MTDLENLEKLLERYEAQGGVISPKVKDRSAVVQAIGAMPFLIAKCGSPVIAWDLVMDAAMEAFEPGTDHPDFKAISAYFSSSNGLAADSIHAEGMHATWLRLQSWKKQER